MSLPPHFISLESQTLFSHSWREPTAFRGDYDCLKGLLCKEAREKAQV